MNALSRPIFLWSAPRSLSTALERVFIERGDFKVVHEPFADVYYFGPDPRSQDFSPRYGFQVGHSHDEVSHRIMSCRSSRVFVKEMAYHAVNFIDLDFIGSIENTFIIRDPRLAIPSLHSLNPNFTMEETGYPALLLLYQRITQLGQKPIVIDASGLLRSPEGTIRAYSRALKITHMPHSLSWKPRVIKEWRTWPEWYTAVQRSTEIDNRYVTKRRISSAIQTTISGCMEIYNVLQQAAIR